jgi:hypothetical protein
MRRPDDVGDDMRGSPIDDDATESLLSGAMSPDDAPPGYREVAVLVRAATPLPGAGAASEAHLVAAFAAEVRGAPRMSAPLALAGRRSRMSRAFSVKVGGLATAMVIGGSAAAAAAGALPASLQSRVASAASHVGLSLPDPGKQPGAPANLAGQCNAYSSVSKGFTDFTNPALTNSTAFQRLSAAAAAQSETVQQYCTTVTSTTSSTSTTSTSTSTTTTTSTSTTTTVASSTTTLPANTFGQCTAYSSVSKGFTDFSNPALTNSTAFQRLAALAAANGETVEQYCAPVLGLPATTTTIGTTTTTTVPGSHGKGGGGGNHGKGGSGSGPGGHGPGGRSSGD